MTYRKARQWVVMAALVGAGLLGLLYVFQRSLIFPARHYSAAEFKQLVARLPPGPSTEIEPFGALLFEPSSRADVRGTAIWFHGNGDVNVDLAFMAPVFTARGLRLVLAEYPGYGARPGTASEQSLVADGKALYAEVKRRYPGSPLWLVGQSLGSGVAVQVASTAAPGEAPARLVLITPYLSLPETVSRVLWMLPVRSLVRDRFDSAAALPRYAGPVAIVTAGHDELVGAEQGRLLAERARTRGETTYIELPGVSHDGWPPVLTEAMWSRVLGAEPLRTAPARSR